MEEGRASICTGLILVHRHYKLPEHLAHQRTVASAALCVAAPPETFDAVHDGTTLHEALVVFTVEQVDLVADHEERHCADVAALGDLLADGLQVLEAVQCGDV